ncbi:MAG: fumarate reductase/succinate dehydrogenase flavoprotein subunit [Candidatus Hodarchaeales archaeon]|jgi:succinate dehydrogenase / fumarate reductase flavoprotein subunit
MSNYNIDDEYDKLERHSYDVLVIGAGGAGLRAAIGAGQAGVNVGIVCKSLLGKAHTVMAEGGAAAALGNVDSRDNWKIHFRDTMRGGKFHNHWRMAQIFAQSAPERILELERWGAVFDRTKDGKINQRNFGGHTYPRLAHVGDRTGLEMIRTLQDHAVHEENVTVFMECTVTKLFKTDGKISGALAYDRQNGKFMIFEAKAVIIASGGMGKAFRVTSNSWEYTGDGFTLALDAGAELIDMEFVQFHPTGMLAPSSVKGTLVTEGVRGEGGILRNNEDERFMFRYIPEMFQGEYATSDDEATKWLHDNNAGRRPPELLTRDVVAKAILAEVKAGRGTPSGGAYLDIASVRDAEYIKKKLPSMYHQFKTLASLDITSDPMEVGPTTHYIMGGIRVDPDTQQATIPGLYAAGEVAAGLHGANRLGGNSLTDLLVFGALAGENAAKYVKEQSNQLSITDTDVKEALVYALAPFNSDRTEDVYKLHQELQKLMEAHVGIIRNEIDVKAGIEKLKALTERAKNAKASGSRVYNPGWHLAIDIQNLLLTSQALAIAALERKESRGAHTRDDYSQTDSTLVDKLYVVSKDHAGHLTLKQEVIPPVPDDLKKIIEGGT